MFPILGITLIIPTNSPDIVGAVYQIFRDLTAHKHTMIQISKHQQCPILSLKMGKKTTTEDTKLYLSEISNNLKLKAKFGILFDFSLGEPEKEKGVLKLENDWFKGYKHEFKKHCFGVAMVSKSYFTLIFWKRLSTFLARRAFGCEVEFFDNKSDAQMWLMDKYLAPNKL